MSNKIISGLVVYILGCESNKYYVGKTFRTPEERFKEHLKPSSPQRTCSWTNMYAPVCIVNVIYQATNFTEDNVTKEMMMIYGIDNVRGGSYSNIHLFDYQVNALEQEFLTLDNKCYNCKKFGHLSSDCPLAKKITPKNKKRKASFDCEEHKHKIEKKEDLNIEEEKEKLELFVIFQVLELFFDKNSECKNIDKILDNTQDLVNKIKSDIFTILQEILKTKELIFQRFEINFEENEKIINYVIKFLLLYTKLENLFII